MRTTLNLDDTLLQAARRRAAEGGETLARVIEQALRQYLQPPELVSKGGRPRHGVTVDEHDALYAHMEGRR